LNLKTIHHHPKGGLISTNKQTIVHVRKKQGLPVSWINSHRKAHRISQEKRKQPRVDCDCVALVAGYSVEARVTDLSLGGCFIAFGSGLSSKLQTGKTFELAVMFPTENKIHEFKAKIIRTEKRGLACQFADLKRHDVEALQRFFDFAKETQPLL
jgi:c-di-GMP-binding flagellar brake protein YcgR